MTIEEDFELAEAKALMTRYINEYRESLCDRYCTYDGKPWDCGATSTTNIMGTLMLGNLNGGALSPGFMWRDYNNVNWEVSLMYMVGLAQKIGGFKHACYIASWTHKANIDAMTIPADILNYNYLSTLWPSPDV